jgi:AcrR family transcriptional regulator
MTHIMEEPLVDSRTLRTKQLLRDTLIELIKIKPKSQITIQEFCAAAGINRGTFYKYYDSIDDMLSMIRGELYKKCQKIVNEISFARSPDIFIFSLLNMLKEERDLCKAVIIAEDYEFSKSIFLLFRDSLFEYWKKTYGITRFEILDGAFLFVTNGMFGVVRKWALNDFDLSPADIAHFVLRISNFGVLAYKVEKKLDTAK